MKVLITGAHFTPAQATIEQLKKHPGISITYIGRKHTMEGDRTPSAESQILPGLGVRFVPLIAGRLRRDFSTLTPLAWLKIPIGFIQSFFIVLNEKPDVILSFGGYVSVPVVFSGWLLSVPIITHEQTLVTGLANKISSFFADKIAVSFDEKYDFPKEKTLLTGNPIRSELVQGDKTGTKKDLIVVLGGNQGSLAINKVVLDSLDELTELGEIVHQTGDSKYRNLEEAIEKKKTIKKPERYKPLKWVDAKEMAKYLREAKVVVSRAGANTLYELAYFKVPTVLIPLPGLYKNEQGVNAKYFEKVGLAKVIEQKELTPEKLLSAVKERLKAKSSFEGGVIPDAAQRLAQEVLILGSRHEDFSN